MPEASDPWSFTISMREERRASAESLGGREDVLLEGLASFIPERPFDGGAADIEDEDLHLNPFCRAATRRDSTVL